MKTEKKKIKKQLYDTVVSFDEKLLVFELQLSKILQIEEEKNNNKEISNWLANMY